MSKGVNVQRCKTDIIENDKIENDKGVNNEKN